MYGVRAQHEAIRVVVVAGVRLYREGLVQILSRDPGLLVTGACSGLGEDAEALAAHADVVLLDLAAAPGIEAARGFVTAVAPVRVVAFGVPDDADDTVFALAAAGMVGYIAPGAGLPELLDATRAVMRGELHCSPRMAGTLLRHVAALSRERPVPTGPSRRLTSRETQIVALVEAGMSNKQIAGQLHIQLATVKNHLHHVFEKLEVHGRGEACSRLRARGADPRAGPWT